ncbi:MAG: DegT/DnrJ/EryC1/StrS family aminotransferase, partial [Gammaproteobacteria bacterium]
YKHLNSGEGGLLVTDDPDLIARAIVLSGSYMLFDRHLAAPDAADIAALAKTTPNYSGRMDNMRAASLLGQLPGLDENCQRWNERYGVLSEGLARIDGITQPVRDSREHFVGSSIQFFLPDFNQAEIIAFVDACADRGVQLKYFGRDEPQGYTSRYDSWEYLGQAEQLTQTNHLLEQLIDMRVPLTFDLDDCQLIVDIIAEVLGEYV